VVVDVAVVVAVAVVVVVAVAGVITVPCGDFGTDQDHLHDHHRALAFQTSKSAHRRTISVYIPPRRLCVAVRDQGASS
jgi:hypothetical protein